MRVRLQAIVLSLVALLVFGLGVPLALSTANSVQQQLFLDRLTDTARFASLAQQPLVDARAGVLTTDLQRYREVYGGTVVVLDQDSRPLASSADARGAVPVDLRDPSITVHIREALAGRRSTPGSLLMPWASNPLILAEPVLVDGEVRGAVLMVSPTNNARDVLWVRWALLVLGGALAFGLALLVAIPVVRWILRPVRRLDEATGSLVAAVVSGRDVEPVGDASGPRELRQLGRSFDRMAASVGETLAAQRAFVADASHQLRNPLTALKLRLDNLEGHVDGEADEHRDAAVSDADRLNQILDGLLSMARAEASGGDVLPVDVDTVLAERVEDWRVVASARDVTLDVTGLGDGFAVLTPPRGLGTILDALLDNALKFTEPGTSVSVDVSSSDGMVELAVRDHGPGLRPEELERAADRFWRSTAHQNVQGSGLGLAIVSQVAAKAGGSSRLDLPEGGGLRVSVRLPKALGLKA
ncbi:MAG: histidine kinase [Amycolatopsis sp.]|jgi:signal transduction histidine kinase|uniref:sensor histidine kinase n=1 Tax=Amycolatopsis sp. TaxID=37632 RepID=UPI0026215721|nr:HAMP domain-containing sensor histidine kinase [Amycolatopsis sp.]MCU1680737.1 histidine kinase [Amycolatopsis sp.]